MQGGVVQSRLSHFPVYRGPPGAGPLMLKGCSSSVVSSASRSWCPAEVQPHCWHTQSVPVCVHKWRPRCCVLLALCCQGHRWINGILALICKARGPALTYKDFLSLLRGFHSSVLLPAVCTWKELAQRLGQGIVRLTSFHSSYLLTIAVCSLLHLRFMIFLQQLKNLIT